VIGLRKKTHEEFVNDFYSKHEPDEYTVLSKFINSSTDVLIRHNICGKVYYAKPYNLYMGKGCRECSAPNKRTHEEYISLIKEKYGDEYDILGRYVGSTKRILVKHNKCGREYYVIANSLLRGRGCIRCAGLQKYTTDQVAEIIKTKTNNEYELVSEYKANNKTIQVKHNECGTVFETTYTLFMHNDSRCPLCNKGYRRSNDLFKKEIYQLVGKEYVLLGEYAGTTKKVLVKHEVCGNEYKVTPNAFLKGSRCPFCNASKGEIAVLKFLTNNKIKHKREYKIKKCRDKQVLPFDFAIFKDDKLAALIEYQGEQHYKSLERFGWKEKFKDRQRKDQIKRKFCQQNNIPLIEIPYTIKDVERYLKKRLKKLDLKLAL
jgi:hypothetical protein